MRNRLFRALTLPAALVTGGILASCGGGGNGAPEMVLVSFNLPNIAGVPLNQPLVYTFSDNVDPHSVTPDTLQVSGALPFTFESIVVDGNLVAELPFIPNFTDYSDAGLQPNQSYNVFLPVFPAVDTIRSMSGRPLVKADPFTFVTTPTFSFIEARRALVHTPGPISGPNMFGDEDGCLQNPNNSLYVYPGFQFGTDADARLLCLANEGSPHILNNPSNLLESSNPYNDKRAVGTASAVGPPYGQLDLGAMRIRFNEPLDPVTVTSYVPATQLSLNVQLWRVGDGDAVPLALPVQVKTTAPTVVQNVSRTEVILVPTGPEPQGTYVINIQSVRDLAGNLVVTSDRPDPAPGGYAAIDASLAGKVPPGYRIYFRTLELPSTSNSITESFGSNTFEATGNTFTFSTPGSAAGNLTGPIAGSPAAGSSGFTLTQANPGQGTVANWNDAYRFLGLPISGRPNIRANTAVDDGAGRLKATFAPYMGNGDDLSFNLPAGSTVLRTDGEDDFNNDGVFEFTDFFLGATSTLTLTGTRPALILVRGSCVINGTIVCDGSKGGFGIDTDGTATYTGAGAIEPSGVGGIGGPGGGNGGRGGPGLVLPTGGDARPGDAGINVLGDTVVTSVGGLGGFGDLTGTTKNQGGGGGGYGAPGLPGVGGTNGGGAMPANADFTRALASFTPQRCYQPGANLSGGSGGGGGGIEDDNGASETGDNTIPIPSVGSPYMSGGDDGGAGGGGGGGGFWVIADTIDVGGTIRCNGGAGGNTYAPAGQVISGGVVVGVVNAAAAGTGGGGAGGGGSGGSILLQARTSLTVQSTAVMSAVGGAGGTASSQNGGAGGAGRIAFQTFKGSAESAAVPAPNVLMGASITPAAGLSSNTWAPTVELTSQGVSQWIDFVTSLTTFSAPFFDDNFATLTSLGLVQGAGQDFNAILEFQGAATLSPSSANPTGGTSVTAWTTNLLSLNNNLFVRWRWRFFVNRADGNAMNDPDFNPLVNPMPQIISFTIPFTK